MFVHSCVSTKEDRPGVGVTGASELYDKGMGNGTQIHCKNNMLLLQSQGFFLLNYFSQVFVTTWKVWIYRCAISRSLAWHTESSCWGNSLMDIPPMDYRVLLFPLLKSFTIASGFVVLHLSFSNKSSKCFFLHASISSRRLRSFRAQAELEPFLLVTPGHSHLSSIIAWMSAMGLLCVTQSVAFLISCLYPF